MVPYDGTWAEGAPSKWVDAHRDDVERIYTRLWQEVSTVLGEDVANRLHIAHFARYLEDHAA